LAKKAKVDAPGDQSATALLHAASHGSKEVMAELLAAGAKLETNLALKRAAYNCHHGAVETLLRSGADLENRGERSGNSPLNVIVRRDLCIDMVRYLIDCGASVNTQNRKGATPLLSAIYYQNLRIAKLLMARGADVNMQDFQGRTALMVAAQSSNLRAVNYLIREARADLTLEDDSGRRYASTQLTTASNWIWDLLLADASIVTLFTRTHVHLVRWSSQPGVAIGRRQSVDFDQRASFPCAGVA